MNERRYNQIKSQTFVQTGLHWGGGGCDPDPILEPPLLPTRIHYTYKFIQ